MKKSIILKKIIKSKGFTLAEVLIVIAIIAILAGVSAIGANAMLQKQRQRASNDAAENIALAFQNRLEEIYAFEYEKREILVNGSMKLSENADDNRYAIGWVGEDICVGSNDELMRDAAYSLLTDGGNLLAEEFMRNGIILEYDPIDCRVYSVLYSSDNSRFAISSSMTAQQILNLFNNNAESAYIAEGTVGAYVVDASTLALAKSDTRENINVRLGHYVNGERRLHNYDALVANIEIKFPELEDSNPIFSDRLKGKQIRLDVKIEGETSKKAVVYALWWPFNKAVTSYTIPIVLDDLSLNNRFYYQFCDNTPSASNSIFRNLPQNMIGSSNKLLEGNGNLLAGEEIKVTVTVESYNNLSNGETDDEPLLSVSASATDNSLFAYDNGIVKTQENNKNVITGLSGTTYKAFIEYGRHLQNLDDSSGIAKAAGEGGIGATSIEAIQIRDIDFKDIVEVDEITQENVIVLWKDAYPSKCFTPITNKKLASYDGGNKKISNLTIDETDLTKSAIEGREYAKDSEAQIELEHYYAGLFRIFSGDEIKNLTLIDPQVTGLQKKPTLNNDTSFNYDIKTVGRVGALAGYMDNSNVLVSNCKVLITGEDGEGTPTGWVITKTIDSSAAASSGSSAQEGD